VLMRGMKSTPTEDLTDTGCRDARHALTVGGMLPVPLTPHTSRSARSRISPPLPISAISDGKAVRVDLSLTMSEPGLSDPGVPTQYDSPSP
jgi:hypothetical protein